MLEEKLAIGTLVIRIFLVSDECSMKERLYNAGFGVTSIEAHGMNGDVKIGYTLIKRKDLDTAIRIIENCQANVFYSIEDSKSVNQGVFLPEDKPNFFPLHTLSKKHYIKHGK